MRFEDICFIIYFLFAVFFIIYTFIYLHTMYKLATYHYYGWISDEIYNELSQQKIKTFKERKQWYAKVKEVIRVAKVSNKRK